MGKGKTITRSKYAICFLTAITLITGCHLERKQSNDASIPPSNVKYYQQIKEGKKNVCIEENIIGNGNFEEYDASAGKFSGWIDRKKQLTLSENASNGARGGKITLSEKPKWGPEFVRGIISYPVDLKQGNYLFSFVCKGQNLTDLKVKLSLPDGKILKSALKVIDFRGKKMKEWEKIQALLKIPEGSTAKQLTLEFLGERGKECKAFIDDVKLVKRNGSSNVMFNSSFEICTVPACPDRWHSDSAPLLSPGKYDVSLVTDTAKSGSNCIKMSYHGPYDKNLAYFSRLMSGFCGGVEKGDKYTVSLWMKTDKPPVKMNLWMNYVNRKTFIIDSKEWKKYTFSSAWRQTWRKTNFAFILLFFEGKEGGKIDANVWVDDIMAEPGEKATAWKPGLEDELYLDKMFAKDNKHNNKFIQTNSDNLEIAAEKVKTGSIVVDGKLDESTWKTKNSAECKTPFRKTAVSNPTLCRIACDDEYLYAALDAKRKTIKGKPKNSSSAFSDDWIEFFLDPDSSDCTYYQFAINRKGNIFTSKCRFDPIAFETPGSSGFTLIPWKPKFDYAISENKEGWKAELKIPLNLFSSELKNRKSFKANFYRVIPETGEANCWSKTRKGFHDIPMFGKLSGIEIKKEFAALEFSDLTFLPSANGNNVIGKLSFKNDSDISSVSAEFVGKGNKAVPLNVCEKNGVYNIKIPCSPQEALGKNVRILAKIKGENVQAFAPVKISKLLILGLNSLVFRNEKSFPCFVSVNLPNKELKKAVLKFAVTERGSEKIVVKSEIPVKSSKNIYHIPFLQLADGWYDLSISLQIDRVTMAKEKSWTYLGKRQENFVRIDTKNMRIERNGLPFFMLGTWGILKDPKINLKKLSRYKKFGFNTITVSLANYRSKYEDYDFDAIFDEAEKAGLLVIVDFCGLMIHGEKNHKYSKKKVFQIIKSFVMKYKNRSNLLMYHGMDEWVAGRQRSLPFCSDEDLEAVYWLVKKNDPYHPFFFNLGPRIWAWGDLRFSDIFSYDCYVRSPNPDETNMERFVYYLKEGEKCASNNAKPMFNVIQFSSGTEIMQTRLMRYNEQRCLAYTTILNDSRGIIFYTGLSWCESKNKHLPPIAKELNELTPILLNYEKQGKIETSSKDIMAKYFQYEGDVWIICANTASREVNGAVISLDNILPGYHNAKAVFNGKNESIKNGRLKLNFKPYECFVYKVNKKK